MSEINCQGQIIGHVPATSGLQSQLSFKKGKEKTMNKRKLLCRFGLFTLDIYYIIAVIS
jgi:hypothetical protein